MTRPPPSSPQLSHALILLMRGVVDQLSHPQAWQHLLAQQAQIRDYVAVLGLQLQIDETEGFAFLRSLPEAELEALETESTGASLSDQTHSGADAPTIVRNLPRLVPRRPLSYGVSLLLVLLRKRLAQADAQSGDPGRLVLSRRELINLVQVFLPSSSNEARLVDQIEGHIQKIVELGFLRPIQHPTQQPLPAAGQRTAGESIDLNDAAGNAYEPRYEVRRLLKSFVDAQWIADFEQRLQAYQRHAQP